MSTCDTYFIQGSIGKTFPGFYSKVDLDSFDAGAEGREQPEKGEICMRGRHVMMGYMGEGGRIVFETRTEFAQRPAALTRSFKVSKITLQK